jgi:hypothetical protein
MEDHTNEQFVEADFSGARFRGVMLSDVEISDAWVSNVEISGLVQGLRVNGIEVTGYVEAELDRLHPERLLLTPDDPDGVRVAWRTIEDLSTATVDRARALPPRRLDESVDGEWSYLETLRHLVFATDRWITGPVLGDPVPFHPGHLVGSQLGRNWWSVVEGAVGDPVAVEAGGDPAGQLDRGHRVGAEVVGVEDHEVARVGGVVVDVAHEPALVLAR